MKIVIDIKTDNAAFQNNQYELSDLLHLIVRKIDGGDKDGVARDSNGNTCGSFKVTGK